MLRTKKASDIAHALVDDGDDIHITASFRANEENSSVVGNASCFGSSRSLPMRSLPLNVKVDSCDDDDSTVSAESTVAMDDNEGCDAHHAATSKKGRFSVKILRGPISLTKKLHRSSEKLLPWSVKPFLSRPRQSRATREYQEMLEHDMPLSPAESDVASFAETVESIRSSRINVATGKTLLVRQKAQVMGRPSVAEAEWDIGSTISSNSSSGASSRRLGLQRSLSWDNLSFGARSDISQLTGDSFRSKRCDMVKSRAMYFNSHLSLLGTTEEEEECENEITKDEVTAPNRTITNGFVVGSQKEGVLQDTVASLQGAARKVVNRLIWETKYIFQEFDDRYAFSAIEINGKTLDTPSHDKFESRARGYSDSDFVFEMQRHRASLDESVVDEHGFQVSSPRETFSSDAGRSRAYSDSYLSNHPSVPVDVDLRPTRNRCASDVYVPRCENICDLAIENIRFDLDNSDTTEVKAPTLQNMLLKAQAQMVDPQQLKRLFIPPSRRISQAAPEAIPLLSEHKVRRNHRRLSSNPEFTTLGEIVTAGTTPSPSINEHQRINGASIRARDFDPSRVLQPVQRGLTSPTAASAAKVIASALRPTNPAGAPPPSMPDVQNYYWNDNSDDESLEEVLWALSTDDSFENLF